jgi:hypothetical protein
MTDEPTGQGRVVLFASEPNFRAYTTGIQKVLWNALFGANPWTADAAKAGSSTSASAERTAVATARAVTTAGFAGIRLTVRSAGAEATRQLLGGLGATYHVVRSPGKVSFLVANPGGAESRLAVGLGAAVRRSRIEVVALVVP